VSDFAPGDVVVCVKADRHPKAKHWRLKSPLRRGAVYRVAAVFVSIKGNVGLAIVGVEPVPPTIGFFADRFRKIDKADEGFATWMRTLREVQQPYHIDAKVPA
jgi:hypothetical protein